MAILIQDFCFGKQIDGMTINQSSKPTILYLIHWKWIYHLLPDTFLLDPAFSVSVNGSTAFRNRVILDPNLSLSSLHIQSYPFHSLTSTSTLWLHCTFAQVAPSTVYYPTLFFTQFSLIFYNLVHISLPPSWKPSLMIPFPLIWIRDSSKQSILVIPLSKHLKLYSY